MPDYNLTNTASEIDQALQDAVSLVTPAATTSNILYGDNGNGVNSLDASVAIKGAKNGNIGNTPQSSSPDLNTAFLSDGCSFQFVTSPTNGPSGETVGYVTEYSSTDTGGSAQMFIGSSTNSFYARSLLTNSWLEFLTSGNTTVDGSGFVKEASPVVKLFSDRIEKNNLVQDSVKMIKNGVGDYTITGSLGFAKSGWYIEQPKDANNQTKHFIEYQQDADGTIHIQVYQPLFTNSGLTKGDPCDVVEGRWIDIRLQKETEQVGE